jgi:hypothetical protein
MRVFCILACGITGCRNLHASDFRAAERVVCMIDRWNFIRGVPDNEVEVVCNKLSELTLNEGLGFLVTFMCDKLKISKDKLRIDIESKKCANCEKSTKFVHGYIFEDDGCDPYRATYDWCTCLEIYLWGRHLEAPDRFSRDIYLCDGCLASTALLEKIQNRFRTNSINGILKSEILTREKKISCLKQEIEEWQCQLKRLSTQ